MDGRGLQELSQDIHGEPELFLSFQSHNWTTLDGVQKGSDGAHQRSGLNLWSQGDVTQQDWAFQGLRRRLKFREQSL